MIKKYEIYFVFCTDFVSITIAWYFYFNFRVYSHIVEVSYLPEYWFPFLIMILYWIGIFLYFGLYRSWYYKSRLDEYITVVKTVTFGTLLLFFIIYLDDVLSGAPIDSRLLIVVYWITMVLSVGTARLLLRTLFKRFLLAGIGHRPTIIIGDPEETLNLYHEIKKFPGLGYDLKGYITVHDGHREGAEFPISHLGSIDDISEIIRKHNIQDVIIALKQSQHDLLIKIIDSCTDTAVSIKIKPDLYDIISGQARTSQIYGFPLMEVMPRVIQPWEESAKRTMDIVVSLFVLLITLPIWFVIPIAIKINSPGPVVFRQERVGRKGKIFQMHKYRSMYHDAESRTGPVWATSNDPRITSIGKFLRKTRLDEIPQFFDVLNGNMSLVGPRPERPYFVEKLSKEIPLYKRRLVVKPGITGWAQVKQGYDQSIDDVRSKIRYDLFYIENMSLRMDITILLMTMYTMITGKGN